MKDALNWTMTLCGLLTMLLGMLAHYDYSVSFGGFLFIAGEINRLSKVRR